MAAKGTEPEKPVEIEDADAWNAVVSKGNKDLNVIDVYAEWCGAFIDRSACMSRDESNVPRIFGLLRFAFVRMFQQLVHACQRVLAFGQGAARRGAHRGALLHHLLGRDEGIDALVLPVHLRQRPGYPTRGKTNGAALLD